MCFGRCVLQGCVLEVQSCSLPEKKPARDITIGLPGLWNSEKRTLSSLKMIQSVPLQQQKNGLRFTVFVQEKSTLLRQTRGKQRGKVAEKFITRYLVTAWPHGKAREHQWQLGHLQERGHCYSAVVTQEPPKWKAVLVCFLLLWQNNTDLQALIAISFRRKDTLKFWNKGQTPRQESLIIYMFDTILYV